MQILEEVMFVNSVNAFKHYQTYCSPLLSSETAVVVQDNDLCNFTEYFSVLMINFDSSCHSSVLYDPAHPGNYQL